MSNYLDNENILKELNKSKISYCWVMSPEYEQYDEFCDDTTGLKEGVVYRVYHHEHIPSEFMYLKGTKQKYRLPFMPFSHYIKKDGKVIEVVRSFWEAGDDVETGTFTKTKGQMTNGLATMLQLLVEKFSHRPNYYNYSYIDDMKAEAMVALCNYALKFDESTGGNPFAYYTSCCNNSFRKIINQEHDHQLLDDTLIKNDMDEKALRQAYMREDKYDYD